MQPNPHPYPTLPGCIHDHIAIASDADGDHVLAWREFQPGAAHSIRAKPFDRSGTPISETLIVASYTTGSLEGIDIAMDGDGDFVITWDVSGVDGSGSGVHARRFAANGTSLRLSRSKPTATILNLSFSPVLTS